MKIKESYVFLIFSLLFVFTACSSHETQMKKAKETFGMEVLVPNYIPPEFKLENVNMEGNLVLLSYAHKEEEDKYIEFLNLKHSSGLHRERIMEIVETGQDPFENSMINYEVIGDYVGEYDVDERYDYISYRFISVVPIQEIDLRYVYHLRSVGLKEAEFQKIISSLEK